ncbi:TRIO and F-actin-binding protein [Labeo rohita]|uniref:TRIO and F-actin-binding protein n=1 Tax=Labeo rohita TaxID=84645 RepID=A0ABQ8MHP2_LABRO|nr:TRIO and F-actin-binding protein [Labeo rohita]
MILCRHQRERNAGRSDRGALKANKDAFLEYACAFEKVKEAIKERRQREGTLPGCQGDCLVGFGVHRKSTYKELYEVKDRERKRDCCSSLGTSKAAAMFSGWSDMVVRLDVWHFMRRFTAGLHTDSHPLYSLFMARLSACIFVWDEGDMNLLMEAKRRELEQNQAIRGLTNEQLAGRLTSKQLAHHCRRRDPTKSYSASLQHSLNDISQRLLGHSLVHDYSKPRQYTGELIGVEYLCSQQSLEFRVNFGCDPDAPDGIPDNLEDVDVVIISNRYNNYKKKLERDVLNLSVPLPQIGMVTSDCPTSSSLSIPLCSTTEHPTSGRPSIPLCSTMDRPTSGRPSNPFCSTMDHPISGRPSIPLCSTTDHPTSGRPSIPLCSTMDHPTSGRPSNPFCSTMDHPISGRPSIPLCSTTDHPTSGRPSIPLCSTMDHPTSSSLSIPLCSTTDHPTSGRPSNPFCSTMDRPISASLSIPLCSTTDCPTCGSLSIPLCSTTSSTLCSSSRNIIEQNYIVEEEEGSRAQKKRVWAHQVGQLLFCATAEGKTVEEWLQERKK